MNHMFSQNWFSVIMQALYNTLIRKLWNPLLLQSHIIFVYLQRSIFDNDKVSSRGDMPSCGPFVFAKGIIGIHYPLDKTKWFSQHDLITQSHVKKQLALLAHSDIREASGFVVTTEPVGFVLTKQVNDFLLRVKYLRTQWVFRTTYYKKINHCFPAIFLVSEDSVHVGQQWAI